jgi:NAD(P)-dependent dehydrogenase (short-subunit alcohol dehydrogenase family)
MIDKNDLKGKVVLITGAGKGLGAATAQAFARVGACVVCLDVDGKAVEGICNSLIEQGAQSIATICNVRDEASVEQAVKEVLDRFGQIDVVVNNAAVDHTAPVDEMTIEQWDKVIGVNLRGPFVVAKAVLPSMKGRKEGHIINVASTAAQRAWANASAYHASKWGLVGFSRGLGVEGRPYNIRVTTIVPGGMKTHFFDRFAEQGIPMPPEEDLQDPANVAEAIVFAASMPRHSVVQEIMVTPLTESSWP